MIEHVYHYDVQSVGPDHYTRCRCGWISAPHRDRRGAGDEATVHVRRANALLLQRGTVGGDRP